MTVHAELDLARREALAAAALVTPHSASTAISPSHKSPKLITLKTRVAVRPSVKRTCLLFSGVRKSGDRDFGGAVNLRVWPTMFVDRIGWVATVGSAAGVAVVPPRRA